MAFSWCRPIAYLISLENGQSLPTTESSLGPAEMLANPNLPKGFQFPHTTAGSPQLPIPPPAPSRDLHQHNEDSHPFDHGNQHDANEPHSPVDNLHQDTAGVNQQAGNDIQPAKSTTLDGSTDLDGLPHHHPAAPTETGKHHQRVLERILPEAHRVLRLHFRVSNASKRSGKLEFPAQVLSDKAVGLWIQQKYKRDSQKLLISW